MEHDVAELDGKDPVGHALQDSWLSSALYRPASHAGHASWRLVFLVVGKYSPGPHWKHCVALTGALGTELKGHSGGFTLDAPYGQ